VKQIHEICAEYHIVLCYLFGSQQERGKAILEGKKEPVQDRESDIDFAVLFRVIPRNSLETYARLSLDLQELVSPLRADVLFLHEVDHLMQLEAINGTILYALDETSKEEYEERVMMLAADEREMFRRNEQDLFEAIEHGYFEFEYKAA
jgi:predicted nucleotidyltransferase